MRLKPEYATVLGRRIPAGAPPLMLTGWPGGRAGPRGGEPGRATWRRWSTREGARAGLLLLATRTKPAPVATVSGHRRRLGASPGHEEHARGCASVHRARGGSQGGGGGAREGTRSSELRRPLMAAELDAEPTGYQNGRGLAWRGAENEGNLFRVGHASNGAPVCSPWSEDRRRYFG